MKVAFIPIAEFHCNLANSFKISRNQQLVEALLLHYPDPLFALKYIFEMPIFDLSNKVVLITGIGAVGDVGWGNGTAMAALFARQGATVFGCDINPEAAEKAANTIRNDAQVKAHPARRKGESPVFVMQESIVRIAINPLYIEIVVDGPG